MLAAVARDLRRHFGNEYRVMRAASGAVALQELRELKLRNDAVALLVVDQRMPEMTGVALLRVAVEREADCLPMFRPGGAANGFAGAANGHASGYGSRPAADYDMATSP